ncbi:c-type cytochrome biogenesis protein CcmI [Paracoccus sp. (in: a-proteobacteria)]|uniref:c-type cytochrome biogenesis protein CcmI n=1 Tax=Paracoccus sp. TaxID=267 RepID=UPI003A886453
MFWLLCALVTLIIGTAIAAPLLRRDRSGAEPAAAYDLRVYRDQLREVERDLERDVITSDEAGRLRNEIGRKVLDADRRMSGEGAASDHGAGLAAIAVLAALMAGAVGLYLREGVPGAPDLPLAERLAMAERAYAARPAQAEAEAQAPARPAPAPAPNPVYAALVEKLREAVAKKPDDPQGLTLLATSEMRLGNMVAARKAQQHLVELRGKDASAGELMQLSALMMEAAGGLITPESEQALARSLQKDPAQPQSLYLLGMLQLQNGRPDRAFPIWRQLLEQGPEDASWIALVRNRMPELAWLAGQPDYVPPGPRMAALPGPDAAAVEATQDMTPAERQQMIAGMVSRLEDRLASEGGSPEEWARLISSLAVIGNAGHAHEIWTEAQTRFADKPEALATVRAAAQQAGLTE